MTFDVTSLLGVLPVTAREITRDETSISWRKVKLRLSVSRSNAPSPESVHEDLPDYEDAPESTHTNDRGGAEDEDDESEEEDELEDDNEVASDIEYSNPLPLSPPHLPSALGLDFTSPIDLTQDDQAAHVLSQLAGINLADSTDEDSSSETRLREAEAFIASAVLQSHSLTSSPPSPPSPPDEPLHEHDEIQSTRMTVRRAGRYETIYGLSEPNPDSNSDEEYYFEVSRPGIARWSSSPPSFTSTATKSAKTGPAHRELSLHPRIPSFLSVIPRYHRTYSSTWFKQNTRVKRVLAARERRCTDNPDLIPAGARGGGFVRKAVERFGPSWRVKVPSVFRYGLRKKEKVDGSGVTVDVVSNSERMRAGHDIERPANVPRVAAPTELTFLSTTHTLSAGDASVSIHPDSTMAQADEDVPKCIIVPSTPPPPPPRSTPLPYLTSQTSPDNQLDYPYIPTPPLDPIALPTPCLTREASLATPRLTREASFASESTSFVPTPESGRLALPGLPALGVPEVLGPKSVKCDPPSADDRVVYPYEYIATPPLPSTALPPTSTPIVLPSLPGSFTPPDVPTHPQPIIPPTLTLPTLTLPTTVPAPLTTILPSFPVGQPPPPLPPLQPPAPIIPPTPPPSLTQTRTAQPLPPLPPLTTVLPSFPVGQPPPPLPPLVPPLVPPLSLVPMSVPLGVAGYMRSPPPPPVSSGFFRPPESQMVTQPPPLSSVGPGSGLASHPGSASGLTPPSSLPLAGPSPSSATTAPALQLQTQLPSPGRITVPEPESMDCREDAYAPLITMSSPTEQLRKLDFVMGEESSLYAVVRPDPGQINTGLLEAKRGEVTTHAVADWPSYQGALDSGYASRKEGKGKEKAKDDGDGLDGDPPPFDESDPLWEELLAYRDDPHGDGLGSSSCASMPDLGQEVAEILGGDLTGAFDLDSSNTSWDFSAVLDSADSNPPNQPKSEDALWKELCAWVDEQPSEMLESVFGMLDVPSVADEPSVEIEPVEFGDFPPLDESLFSETPLPTIAVESAEPSPSEYYSHLQSAQDATDFDRIERIRKYPSHDASPSFSLDELDWAVMEEYAQLEDLECPSSSVDAARVMVIAIRAVAAKAKAGFAGTSDGQAFLPIVDFPSGPCGIVGGQSVSPSYEYISLLDEDAQVPLVNSNYHPPSTSLAHALAAS